MPRRYIPEVYATLPDDVTWPDFINLMEGFHDRLIVDKHENELFCPGTFRSEYRHGDNVEYCGILGLDYDHGDLSPQDFARRLPGITHLCHSTHTSRDSHPKFRVFIPVTRRLTPDEYRALTHWLITTYFAGYHFDHSASIDPSRGFYLPCRNAARPLDAFFEVVDGEVFPVDEAIPVALRAWQELVRPQSGHLTDQPDLPASEAARRAQQYADKVTDVRHVTLRRVGHRLYALFGEEGRQAWDSVCARYVSTDKRPFTHGDRDRLWKHITSKGRTA